MWMIWMLAQTTIRYTRCYNNCDHMNIHEVLVHLKLPVHQRHLGNDSVLEDVTCYYDLIFWFHYSCWMACLKFNSANFKSKSWSTSGGWSRIIWWWQRCNMLQAQMISKLTILIPQYLYLFGLLERAIETHSTSCTSHASIVIFCDGKSMACFFCLRT